jgi:UDP-glucose 4-epimerase
MGERILVTGGAGFIGSHIAEAFLAAGHQVSVLDNLWTGKRDNVPAGATFYQADLRDVEALERVFAQERPQLVAHEAALANVRGSLEHPAEYATVNVIGTLNLLEAARRHGVRKVLFASTGGAIYGDPEHLPADESCRARPLDPYGASKLACEHFLYTYYHNNGLQYCALRYPNVYGPRQDPYGEAGVVAIFAGQMLRGAEPAINGDGTQARDFVHVSDVARGNVLALERGQGIINLGSGIPTDVNAIYDHLARLTAYNGPRRHRPAILGEVKAICLASERAQRELGWSAQVPLARGLGETVDYLRAHLVQS